MLFRELQSSWDRHEISFFFFFSLLLSELRVLAFLCFYWMIILGNSALHPSIELVRLNLLVPFIKVNNFLGAPK